MLPSDDQCAYCGGSMAGSRYELSTKGPICDGCFSARAERQRLRRERRSANLWPVVRDNLLRAQKAGAAATLTVAEWRAILDRHHWRCAYCQTRPYEDLEHRTPISKGGGTTADNCVPACKACNAGKGQRTAYVPISRSIKQRAAKFLHVPYRKRSTP